MSTTTATAVRRRRHRRRRPRPPGWRMRPGAWLMWGMLAFFLLNLAGVIGTVLLDSFARTWFNGWLPRG